MARQLIGQGDAGIGLASFPARGTQRPWLWHYTVTSLVGYACWARSTRPRCPPTYRPRASATVVEPIDFPEEHVQFDLRCLGTDTRSRHRGNGGRRPALGKLGGFPGRNPECRP